MAALGNFDHTILSGGAPEPDSPYAETIYGKTPSVHGIGRAGAKLRDIAMGEKKLNYFAKLIRRMHVEDALAQCALQPKKAGRICAQVGLGMLAALHSAIALRRGSWEQGSLSVAPPTWNVNYE